MKKEDIKKILKTVLPVLIDVIVDAVSGSKGKKKWRNYFINQNPKGGKENDNRS